MMKSTKSARRETASCTEGKKEKRKLPDLKPWAIGLYLVCAGASAGAILQASLGLLPEAAGYPLYGVAFFLLCASAVYVWRGIRRLRQGVLIPLIEANPLTRRVYRDYGYRTLLTAGLGTAVNLAFMLYNGLWGILNRSLWFVTVAVYYSLLGGIRFFSLQAKRRADREEDRVLAYEQEMAVMRRDGFLLLAATAVLGGMIFLKIAGNMVTPYSQVFAIATAVYTFYKIILAVRNIFKVRRLGSPILTAVRNIALADALVSLFSLQALLLVSFATEESRSFDKLMNSITGLAVWLVVSLLGICMARAFAYGGKKSQEE